jgi:hypothetical protein
LGNIRIAAGGAEVLTIDDTTVTVTNILSCSGMCTSLTGFRSDNQGLVNSVAFGVSNLTGFYSTGSQNLSIATNGVLRLGVTSTSINAIVPYTTGQWYSSSLGSQTAGNCSIRPTAQANTGIFGTGTTNLGLAVGGNAMISMTPTAVTLSGSTTATLTGTRFGTAGSVINQRLRGFIDVSNVIAVGDVAVVGTVVYSTAFASEPVVTIQLRCPSSGSNSWDRSFATVDSNSSNTGFSIRVNNVGPGSTSGTARIFWVAEL